MVFHPLCGANLHRKHSEAGMFVPRKALVMEMLQYFFFFFSLFLFCFLNNWTYLCAANGHCNQEQHSHTWRHLEGWEDSQDGRAHKHTRAQYTHARTHTCSRFSSQFTSSKLKLCVIFRLTISLGEEKCARCYCGCVSRRECVERLWAGEMWKALRNSLGPSPPNPDPHPHRCSSPLHYFHCGQ